MADLTADTIAWYDRQAADFAARTACLDLTPIYDRFLCGVRPGGRILDAGCGVGRDALAFAERAYEVVAFDASVEMARLARERVGDRAEILRLRFEDVAWQRDFNGIWASASLLHVPRSAFGRVAKRFAAALRPRGVCYMSLKLGESEHNVAGRLFVDHTEKTLRAALVEADLDLFEHWISADVRPGREGERWLNALARTPKN